MTAGFGKAKDDTAIVTSVVGANLRRVCAERGISRETLATRTGESLEVVSWLELVRGL